jgi:hypothetical protein
MDQACAALSIAIVAFGCAGERVHARADGHGLQQEVGATQAQGSSFEMVDKQKRRATGRTEVQKYEPTAFDEVPGGSSLADVHATETFSGDIEGEGVVHGVQAARPDGASSFVGIERVRGALDGKKGTFLLQVQRSVVGKEATGEWFVIPDSGTGELSGLRGNGGFKAELGQHGSIWLDYSFEATP